MSRPSFDAPEWATDATYPVDAGPDAGGNTKIAPPGAYTAMGFRRDNPALAQYINDLHNKQGAWLAYWQQYFNAEDIDLTAVDGAFEGALVFSPTASNPGWYWWTATPVGADDINWLISSPGGQWVHSLYKSVVAGGTSLIASVGVVPGLTGSADGRILKSVVPWGIQIFHVGGPSEYDTTSTSLVTLETWTIGTLQVGDIVEFHLPSDAHDAGGDFTVKCQVTQNGGSAIDVNYYSAGSFPPVRAPTVMDRLIALSLSFTHTVTVAGSFVVLLKGVTSAGSLHVNLGGYNYKVYRP